MENQSTNFKEHFVFYKLPNHILESMKAGESFSSESLKEFVVDEKDVHRNNDKIDCYVEGHSTITCKCKDAQGNEFTRIGYCDVYYRTEGGETKYCYTRCPSCYSVCS